LLRYVPGSYTHIFHNSVKTSLRSFCRSVARERGGADLTLTEAHRVTICTDLVVIETTDRAPYQRVDEMYDGMIDIDGQRKPGAILKLWHDLRGLVGVLEAKTKQGVKFKVRSAEDLYDKVAKAANHLGILIYPVPEGSSGKGHIVDSGTLAEVSLHVVCQAIEDGSRLSLWGFGLGADNQDKAGGKAGTYAFKQAVVQGTLAGGTKAPPSHKMPDTDDTDTPIPGGVRPKKPAGDVKLTVEEAKESLAAATDKAAYNGLIEQIKRMPAERQMELLVPIKEAAERIRAAMKGAA
jgi:hypothetical protein